MLNTHTIPNTLIPSETKHSYLFLTHSNFTNSKHLKIYKPVLNYHKNMRSLSVHPNHYKKNIYFFFIQYKKRKMPSLSTKEKKAKFNTDDLIFRKNLIYLLEHHYLYQATLILNAISLSAAPLNTTLLSH